MIHNMQDYYSKYEEGRGRINTVHWVDQDDQINLYIERGVIGDALPPIPRMGLLSLPWSEDERLVIKVSELALLHSIASVIAVACNDT